MLKKLLLSVMTIAIAVSCGSSSKKEEAPEPREFAAPSFQLLEASSRILPLWIKKPEEGDKVKNRSQYRYFISEATHINKRLCLRSSAARASAEVARGVAQFIKNSYAEATQGEADDGVSQYMQEQLAQETQSFLVGVDTIKSYWEHRRYKVSLGAERDEVKYVCHSLVRMKKDDLRKAMSAARSKLLKNVNDVEVKDKTEKIIEDAEKAFLDKV